MNRIRRLLQPVPHRPRTALAPLLALALLLAACAANPFAQQRRVASLTDFQQVCLAADVTAGSHAIPAFNNASVRAMSRQLAGTALEPASECGSRDVRLAYRMAFDARTLSWNAEMRALNAAGELLWRGAESAGIPADGAFQYLSESNAEALLGRFVDESGR